MKPNFLEFVHSYKPLINITLSVMKSWSLYEFSQELSNLCTSSHNVARNWNLFSCFLELTIFRPSLHPCDYCIPGQVIKILKMLVLTDLKHKTDYCRWLVKTEISSHYHQLPQNRLQKNSVYLVKIMVYITVLWLWCF